MIILAYYECVLRVMSSNKKIYEYTNVLPLEYKSITRMLKFKQIGKAWQYLKKTKECYYVQERPNQTSEISICGS